MAHDDLVTLYPVAHGRVVTNEDGTKTTVDVHFKRGDVFPADELLAAGELDEAGVAQLLASGSVVERGNLPTDAVIATELARAEKERDRALLELAELKAQLAAAEAAVAGGKSGAAKATKD